MTVREALADSPSIVRRPKQKFTEADSSGIQVNYCNSRSKSWLVVVASSTDTEMNPQIEKSGKFGALARWYKEKAGV
jgi:hypothetical protein